MADFILKALVVLAIIAIGILKIAFIITILPVLAPIALSALGVATVYGTAEWIKNKVRK